MFNNIPHTYAAEIAGGAGFDWVVVDAEHSPYSTTDVLHHLQALAAHDVSVIVRPPVGDEAILKRYLDIGANAFLIPMVDTAEQAEALVRATRYPPTGIRGVGAAMSRAAQWRRRSDYFDLANDDVYMIVQAESTTAINNLDAIAAVEGVDAVFIGPADLSASMGYLGQPTHPEVVSLIETSLGKIRAAGKAAGVLALDPALVTRYVEAGANLVAVGVDIILLEAATREVAERFVQ